MADIKDPPPRTRTLFHIPVCTKYHRELWKLPAQVNVIAEKSKGLKITIVITRNLKKLLGKPVTIKLEYQKKPTMEGRAYLEKVIEEEKEYLVGRIDLPEATPNIRGGIKPEIKVYLCKTPNPIKPQPQ
jgi:hypothetical protein